MSPAKLEINPSVTVDALLQAYPELEFFLIGLAPPFKKLHNPMLRKSVAKVATLKHIAAVGSIPCDERIAKIREAVGQETNTEFYWEQECFGEQPDWFSTDKVTLSLNEDKVEDKDKLTLVIILKEAKNVKPGEIIELVTSFLPAPGIDIMKTKGYSVWTKKESDDLFKSYFLKRG